MEITHMSDKNKAEETPTVITLVLPTDTSKAATVTVRNGDLGHMSTFAYDGFKDICVALNEGMTAFVQVQANPPKDIKSAKPKPKQAKASKKAKKAKKAPGKPPYKLIDGAGNTRTLDKMFDPFELQEKYHKSNPKFQFDELDEAVEVATVLIEAGLEKTISIAYSNGKIAKVLPEADKPEDSDNDETMSTDDDDDVKYGSDDAPDINHPEDAEESATDDVDDQVEPAVDSESDREVASELSDITYPDALDTAAKRAIYDIVTDEARSLAIYKDIMQKKKHGWKKNLIKQREVKGFIAVHVDGKENVVEQVYQIALDSSEFDDSDDEAEPTTTSETNGTALVQVLTSPELAAKNDVPVYQEFSLATDDEDSEDIQKTPENDGQAALF
jgi:hypothetical protein